MVFAAAGGANAAFSGAGAGVLIARIASARLVLALAALPFANLSGAAALFAKARWAVNALHKAGVIRAFDRPFGTGLLCISQSSAILVQGAPINPVADAHAALAIPNKALGAVARAIFIVAGVAGLRICIGTTLAIILETSRTSAGFGFVIPFIIQRAVALLIISPAVIGTAAANADNLAAIHIAALADVTPCFILGAVAALTAIRFNIARWNVIRGVIIAGA